MRQSLLLLVFFSCICQAQVNISGRVSDGKNPLPFVNVVLLNATDSTYIQGVVSKDDGSFSITCSDARPSILRLSFLGYATVYLNNPSGNVGEIVLYSAAVVLKEAVVTAHRPTFRLKGGNMLVNIENSTLSKAGTANDVLSQLPGIRGGDGNFYVFGKGAAIIYINGRIVRDISEIDMLNSSDIKAVEIISNPGAQYDATIKAVIRIKTVKRQGDGWSGSLRSIYGQAHDADFVEQANLNYRKNGLDVFGTLFYSDEHRRQDQKDVRTVYSKNNWIENSKTLITNHEKDIYGAAGMNYVFGENHSIGFKYSIDKSPGNKSYLYSTKTMLSDGKEEGQIHSEDSESMPAGANHQLSTYYDGKVGKLQINFNGDYMFSKSSRNQNLKELSEEYGNQNVLSYSHAKNHLFGSKLIFSYPVFDGTFSIGSEYSNTRRYSNYYNEENILSATDDKIKEQNLAGFTEYNIHIGKLDAGAGFRYEHVVSNYYEYRIKQDGQSRKYDNFFPNLSLGYDFKKVQTLLSYTIKTYRPPYYSLSSFVQYDSRFLYEGGNPQLRPQTINDLSWQALYSWLQLSLSYQYKKNTIIAVDKFYKNTDIIVLTFDNLQKLQTLNAMLSASPKIGCWEPQFSVSLSRQIIDAASMGISEKLQKPIWDFQLNNSFTLPKDFIVRLNLQYSTSGNNETDLSRAQGGVDLSLYKSFFNKHLLLNFQAFDIFKNKKGDSTTFFSQHMKFYKDNYAYSRRIRLTVTYKFNTVRSKYKGTGAGNDEKQRF